MKLIKTQLKQIKKNIAKANQQQQTASIERSQSSDQKTTKEQREIDVKIDFKTAVGKVKPIVHDTIHATRKSIKKKTSIYQSKNKETRLENAEFHFSDEYEPQLPTLGAMKYVRSDVSSYESKSLRRGDYVPELILDLHGLNQQQTKREISALLQASQKQHINCVCIVHGIGSKILKNKVPHWLVQHPKVMAFHQATLEWGGDGALLVLLEVEDR